MIRVTLCAAALVFAGPPAAAAAPAATPTALQAPVQDDELDVGRADRYSEAVDRAVGCLVRGDVRCFQGMLSEETIKHGSQGGLTIDKIIETRFVPFFSDFARLTDTVTTVTTRDAAGDPGLAFFRTFETAQGLEKPFAIYIINQRGTIVVGNLIPNATAESQRLPRQ